MATQQLTNESSSEKAWHVLSLLLSLGRPARPAEIASRCTLFRATPDLIQSLCLIPNSPISLTNNLYITLSLTALLIFADFVTKNFGISYAFRSRTEGRSCSEDFFRMIFMRRKRTRFDDSDDCEVPLPKRIQSAVTKVHYRITDGISRSINVHQNDMLAVNQVTIKPPFFGKFSSRQLSCKLRDIVHIEGEAGMKVYAPRVVPKRLMYGEFDAELALETRSMNGDRHAKSSISIDPASCVEDMKQSNVSSANIGIVNNVCKATTTGIIESDRIVESKEKEQLIDLGGAKRIEKLFLLFDTDLNDVPPESESKKISTLSCDGNKPSMDNNHDINVNTWDTSVATELPITNKQLRKPYAKTKFLCRDGMDPKLQTLSKFSGQGKAFNIPKEKHGKRDQMPVIIGLKAMEKQNDNKDEKGNSTRISPKDQTKPKALPNFESYIIEQEEGSGGYGTVYRARRKNDGTIVAIKCPHANANKHHVNNELRMLERFGGKNFIIKYQGSFKSSEFDCFVLEHVEHDRPEVLKKEIDISQLQWYGYCMFRALASLHKQGVVHRDVKPGNFLFSREAAKGYLIDFNLTMDLHQKFGTINKLKVGYDVSFNHATIPYGKYIPPMNRRKVPSANSLDAVKQEAAKGLKSTLDLKNLKRKAAGRTNVCSDVGSRNIINSQGADGSGITSAKDVSTRTPSAERLREPLPCQGRKELISLLQEALRTSNYEASKCPAPMRKRVAAPPGKVGREFLYITPMPLHSNGIAVAGAGLMKNKGNGKHKREGPCAGTKGFRAPEVLFRSQHQGPKLDIWSAGVTLLYLMIARTPFFGDPEQNIKDIAKLRGTEDLWEVAKLCDRESSFPEDLYDKRSLAPMKLRDWCKLNTKKPDFLEEIPSSLFDLVDKCLTVNPRLRLTAEDALKHEFFAPCHESLKRQKLLRQGLSLDNSNGNASQKQCIAKPEKISQ